MPFDPGLAARLDELVADRFAHVIGLAPKKMFGGIGYMLNGNMCFGIYKDMLMIRVGEATAAKVLQEKHVRPMDLTGKIMKGWATVQPEAMVEDEDLERFCRYAVDFVARLPGKLNGV